jgi:acetyltransferase
VAKLLVDPAARGRRTAGALLAALEAEALRRGRWLLVLDTRTGSLAEPLYERWGWHRVGVIEDYAADPDGTLAPTTVMTKRLR